MPIYYFTAPGGGYSTGMLPAIAEKDVQEVIRDGIKYRKNVVSLPGDKEFNYDYGSGEVSFDTNAAPLQPGEEINIIYNNIFIGGGKF